MARVDAITLSAAKIQRKLYGKYFISERKYKDFISGFFGEEK